MRTSVTAILFSFLITLALAPGAWSANGVTTGTPGDTPGSGPSSQVVLHHSFPPQCRDAFVGGVKLRGAPVGTPGTIIYTGGPVIVFAELYWTVYTDGTFPPPTETFNGAPLARTACGPATSTPCWYPGAAFAFHADVSGLVVAGPNVFAGFPNSGSVGTPAETPGASLVVVYAAATGREIIVTCGNDLHPVAAGGAFDTYLNPLPVGSPPGTPALLTFIASDGQPAFDEVGWNGVILSAGDAYVGDDPGPGLGYWDTDTYPVVIGPPNTASSGTPGGGDCINWVATVLRTEPRECQVPVESSTWGRIKNQYVK